MSINEQLNFKYREDIKLLIIKEFNNFIYLDNIVIKNKGKGIGQSMLQDLLQYAISQNKQVTLYPKAPKTSRKTRINKLNQRRLENFYLRNGFTWTDSSVMQFNP